MYGTQAAILCAVLGDAHELNRVSGLGGEVGAVEESCVWSVGTLFSVQSPTSRRSFPVRDVPSQSPSHTFWSWK